MSNIQRLVEANRPELQQYEALYKKLHANPELSHQERETSALVLEQLQGLGNGNLSIKTGIGGYGLIAVLRNGEGPVVLARADMDALPVAEQTGLDYASTKYASRGEKGTPVMHGMQDFSIAEGGLSDMR
jgi:metal-dependent amidase/aminoacylase/carboxypeptidase family protein